MNPEVKKSGSVREIETKERCYILEVANDSGDELISIARARVKSGVATAWHLLKGVSERYIIISGEGRVEIQGIKPTEVTEGDIVRIPPNTPQRIINLGKSDLIFYCVCTPPFHADSYEELQ